MKKILILLLLALLAGNVEAAVYCVKPDGTCTAASKASAVVADAAACTAVSSAGSALNMTTASAVTSFTGGDTVLFSAKNLAGTDTAYTAELTVGSAGVSASSKVIYSGIADGAGETYPTITNTTGSYSAQIGNYSFVTVRDFKIIANNATNGFVGVNFWGATKDRITLENIMIDLTLATGTAVKGMYGSSAPFTNLTLSNFSIIMGTGANKTYPIWFIGTASTRGSNWTLNNVSLNGGTKSIIQYVDGLTISGITLAGNTDENAGALNFTNCGGLFSLAIADLSGSAGLYFTASNFNQGSTITGLTGTALTKGITFNASSGVVVSNSSIAGAATKDVGYKATLASHDIFFNNCTLDGGAGNFYFDIASYNIYTLDSICKNVSGHCFVAATATTHDITFDKTLAINSGTKTVGNFGIGYVVHDAKNITLKRPIAVNMVSAGIALLGESTGEIYNATLYNNGGNWSAEGGGKIDSIRANIDYGALTATSAWTVINTYSGHGYPTEIFAPTLGTHTIDHNAYQPLDAAKFINGPNTFAAWKLLGYDVNSVSGIDPLFVSVPAADAAVLSATDFRLQASSPLINAGVSD